MKITLKNGEVKEFSHDMTAAEAAEAISAGLARNACAARIDGQTVDLRTRILKDCRLEILTFEEEEGRAAFWLRR